MSRPYSDYLRVNKDFIPVFNIYEDEMNPQYWKVFFPHNTFINILGDLIGSIEGNTSEGKRSLWVHGAYGTGKSFASFTLKHLIEEDEDNVCSYFQKYGIRESLRKRLEGIKSQGDILVVNRESSSSIIGDNRLFIAIQETIKEALKRKGCTYFGGKTLYDNILDKIRDPDNVFNFNGAFNKYKEKFLDHRDVNSVIRELEELGADGSLELLQRIVDVADRSGFNFATTANDVVLWLEDVISANKLQSIVFIWDEFTDYFKINQNSTSGLQELAQASARIPFYFLLITHKSHEQFIYDKDTRKVLEARFKLNRIDMAETTAFMLMRNAIEVEPNLKEEWDVKKSGLWFEVERTVRNTINRYSEDIKNDDLKCLLPLHPYSALMLQYLSSHVNSNQRTMFKFLCGDPDENGTLKKNFRWFIGNHGLYNREYLSCDYIWDYFFEPDNVDLDERAKNLMGHYNNFESQCENENAKKVLKAVLLLTAVQQERGRGLSNLLRPALSNIKAVFAGTSFQDDVEGIMNSLVQKGVMGSIPEGPDTLYVVQSQNIDEERLKNFENDVRNNFSFDKLIVSDVYNITANFKLSGYASQRFEILSATHRNLKKILNDNRNLDSYKIPLVFIFARNEEDSAKNSASIQAVLKDQSRDIVIADISSQPLTDREYDNFIKCMAKAKYFLGNHQDQASLNKTQAKSVIDSWKQKINNTMVKIYSTDSHPVQLIGIAQFQQHIDEINSKIFTYGLESITGHNGMFSEKGYKDSVCVMGMDKKAISSNFHYLNIFKSELKNNGIWDNNSYHTLMPTHTLSKMKDAVEQEISVNFTDRSSVAIADIWNVLKEKPFGLFPCTGTAFVMGFLLKEYADSGFYKKDGIDNNVPLTHDNLADMIVGIIKGLPKADCLYIVKMTEEHELFCKYSGDIFRLSSDRQNSIQDVRKGINIALDNIGFPLWTLKHYDDDKGLMDDIKPAIDLYCEFISGNRDETKIAEEIARFFKGDIAVKDHLKKIFTGKSLKEGMDQYISHYKPELVSLAGKLGVSKEYIGNVKGRFSKEASWLWNKGDIDHQIDLVCLDYKLIDAINRILLEQVSTPSEAANAIKSRIGAIKMPFDFFKANVTSFEKLFTDLINIYKTGSFKDINKDGLISELDDNSDLFNSFFLNQTQIFRKEADALLGIELSDEEVEYLYSRAESNAVGKPLEVFRQWLNAEFTNYQKNQKFRKLKEKWKDVTNTVNPNEWSKNNRIPVLCLFTDKIAETKQIFDIINNDRPSANENSIDNAMKFIVSNEVIELLNNPDRCNQMFRMYVSGEYDLLLEDVDEIKKLLVKEMGTNVYGWSLRKKEIDDIIKYFATEKYNSTYYNNVFKKIDILSPEQAKNFLKDLIKNEPLVGIKIMKS